ncbi:hypothetical protein [Rhodococcus sp. ARC_M6]|uniref:hypothetical protein n=1 Tax=Rhodococcus sp. ARC_M6 TaxID=2928852 RepID=UPI001FB2EC04|nr:hypothetical protein [Rhodococcus sp. ARC_M6]MCJ0907089.1 hypothetical protein [Rhodococcus sp. ARC_M6]
MGTEGNALCGSTWTPRNQQQYTLVQPPADPTNHLSEPSIPPVPPKTSTVNTPTQDYTIKEVYQGQPCSGPEERGKFGRVPAGCIEDGKGHYYWQIFF